MAKKKRTQLKPVNRGFSTTSVPKKVVQVEPEPEPEPIPPPEPVAEGSISGAGPPGVSLSAEEQSLQELIERYQDKTEKDVCRTVKVSDSCCV